MTCPGSGLRICSPPRPRASIHEVRLDIRDDGAMLAGPRQVKVVHELQLNLHALAETILYLRVKALLPGGIHGGFAEQAHLEVPGIRLIHLVAKDLGPVTEGVRKIA